MGSKWNDESVKALRERQDADRKAKREAQRNRDAKRFHNLDSADSKWLFETAVITEA